MRRGVVVVVRRGRLLLVIRRATGVAAPGAWCFVGGAREPGESEEGAVVREFREEVGGVVRPLRRIWDYRSPDGRLSLAWWLAELDESSPRLEPNPAEVAELAWLDAREIARLPDLLESNREFLEVLGCDGADPSR